MTDPRLDTLDIARDELLLKMAATLCRIAGLVGDQVEADELTETRECFAEKLDEELSERLANPL